MSKLKCNISEDLMPLYIEDILSEESKKDMELHLEECENCKKIYNELKEDVNLEYEKNMFYFNMEMTGIETIFFLAKPELEPLNSTRMRELHAFGQDVSAWVPENVSRELRKLDEKK